MNENKNKNKIEDRNQKEEEFLLTNGYRKSCVVYVKNDNRQRAIETKFPFFLFICEWNKMKQGEIIIKRTRKEGRNKWWNGRLAPKLLHLYIRRQTHQAQIAALYISLMISKIENKTEKRKTMIFFFIETNNKTIRQNARAPNAKHHRAWVRRQVGKIIIIKVLKIVAKNEISGVQGKMGYMQFIIARCIADSVECCILYTCLIRIPDSGLRTPDLSIVYTILSYYIYIHQRNRYFIIMFHAILLIYGGYVPCYCNWLVVRVLFV